MVSVQTTAGLVLAFLITGGWFTQMFFENNPGEPSTNMSIAKHERPMSEITLLRVIESWQWRSGEAHCDRELAVEVRRGPLRSRAGRGGPARPTAIESWQWRSGEAHCDRELAVEVRRGPLRSRAGRGGPARPTAIESWQWRSGEAPAIESWQWRSGEAHCDQELAEEVRRGPLRLRAGSGGPARPTAIESWQWRSGEAHCDRELAVEVR